MYLNGSISDNLENKDYFIRLTYQRLNLKVIHTYIYVIYVIYIIYMVRFKARQHFQISNWKTSFCAEAGTKKSMQFYIKTKNQMKDFLLILPLL